MTFALTLQDAQAQFPDYTFVKALTPSRLLKKSVEWDRQIDPGVLPCSQYC